MSETKKLTLIQKLAKISHEIGSVAKDGENKHHHYKYLSIDAVYGAVGSLLAKYEIFVTSEIIECHNDQVGKGFYVTVWVKYIFHSGDETIETQNYASAMDYSDKASTQAMRAAQKYCYIQSFNIVSGESDPDKKSPEVIQEAPKTQPKKEPTKPNTIPDNKFSIDGLMKAGWNESLDNGFIKLKDKKGKDIYYELSKDQIKAVENHLQTEEMKAKELIESGLTKEELEGKS